jgi:hypothetical protein
MKIVSQDTNVLVAVDKAYNALATGVIVVVAGAGLTAAGVGARQPVLTVIGVVLLVIGAAMVAFRKVRTLTINKGADQVIFDLKSLVKKGARQCAVSDVVKVEFTTSYHTTTTQTNTGQARSGISLGSGGIGGGGTTQTMQQTQVHLLLKDGTIIDLADGQRSMSTLGVFGKVPNLEVAQAIAAFLQVPFEQQGPA